MCILIQYIQQDRVSSFSDSRLQSVRCVQRDAWVSERDRGRRRNCRRLRTLLPGFRRPLWAAVTCQVPIPRWRKHILYTYSTFSLVCQTLLSAQIYCSPFRNFFCETLLSWKLFAATVETLFVKTLYFLYELFEPLSQLNSLKNLYFLSIQTLCSPFRDFIRWKTLLSLKTLCRPCDTLFLRETLLSLRTLCSPCRNFILRKNFLSKLFAALSLHILT